MGDEAANSKNEVHELENWRIRIRQEEGCAGKWEDWWGWLVKVRSREAGERAALMAHCTSAVVSPRVRAGQSH